MAFFKELLRSTALGHVSVALLANPGEEVATGLKRSIPLVSKEVIVAALKIESHLTLFLGCWVVKIESSIMEEGIPFGFVKLGIITLDNEWLVLRLECLSNTIFLPVLFLSIGLVSTFALLFKILVEGDNKVTLKDS